MQTSTVVMEYSSKGNGFVGCSEYAQAAAYVAGIKAKAALYASKTPGEAQSALEDLRQAADKCPSARLELAIVIMDTSRPINDRASRKTKMDEAERLLQSAHQEAAFRIENLAGETGSGEEYELRKLYADARVRLGILMEEEHGQINLACLHYEEALSACYNHSLAHYRAARISLFGPEDLHDPHGAVRHFQSADIESLMREGQINFSAKDAFDRLGRAFFTGDEELFREEASHLRKFWHSGTQIR